MKTNPRKKYVTAVSITIAAAWIAVTASAALAHGPHGPKHKSGAFIDNFNTVNPGAPSAPVSGPEAGDQNPYGVAVVPASVGSLVQGNVLVSNFNNAGNLQGTGSSIVQYAPNVASQSTFAEIDASTLPGACPGGVGLTTALVVLRSGWVIVGSLPTSDGMIDTVGAGCLIVLDANGNPVETFSGGAINGPWDMTAIDNGSSATLFFTNVLNGDVATAPPDTPVNEGTVARMTLRTPAQGSGMPTVIETKIIGSGFAEENDSAALIIGPTGVAFGNDNSLYVADTVNSRIARIPGAANRGASKGTGQTVSSGGDLAAPLGLVLAPNGDILTVNAGNGNIVEVTTHGDQTSATISPGGGGALFGLAVMPGGGGIYFVDDSENQLNLFN